MSDERERIGDAVLSAMRQYASISRSLRPAMQQHILRDAVDDILPPRGEGAEAVAPVPVTICCPACAMPHVDEGEWATTRHHKTHQCQGCGHEWRPFPFATVGVAHPAGDEAPSVMRAERMREIVCEAAIDARVLLSNAPVYGPDKTLRGMPTADVERIDTLCQAILAALSPQGLGSSPDGDTHRVADGWVLVPREPTEAMIRAALPRWIGNVTSCALLGPDDAKAIYRAMIQAAEQEGRA